MSVLVHVRPKEWETEAWQIRFHADSYDCGWKVVWVEPPTETRPHYLVALELSGGAIGGHAAIGRGDSSGVVLIVDDDADARDLYGTYLRARGYSVLLATNGEEGVVAAREARPDVIVMDLGMPHVSGWEAIRRLKQDGRTRHIPIIVCTAHAVGRGPELALDAGCAAYFVKPCLPEELLAGIRRALR